MPGNPRSETPAIDGPARTKAKASMKLIVRISLSPRPNTGDSRVWSQPDNEPLFPDIYAKRAKWFRRDGEMFRPPMTTKHWPEKPNDFRASEF